MLRIGIAGLGTVGCGLIDMIERNHDSCHAKIVAVNARDKSKPRAVDISKYEWVDDVLSLATRDDIDCVVELIGGAEGTARDLVTNALKAGKKVVTANKALIADHGYELAELAEAQNCFFGYEAAVAGGIPIIKALRESFAGNEITAIRGILNGTCNYILSTMRQTGRDFADVLKDAQDKGYAESDPTFDVEGIDAGHKLAILAALGFGMKVPFEKLSINGVSALSAQDIDNAGTMDYRVKLLGIAQRAQNGAVTLSVEPCFVPKSNALAHVEDVLNAVQVDCVPLGRSMLVGAGAGSGPTASSVYADLCDAVTGLQKPVFGKAIAALSSLPSSFDADMDALVSRYYMRLSVVDKSGVIADLAGVLKTFDISISDMVQKGRGEGEPVDLILVMHETPRRKMQDAAKAIEALSCVKSAPVLLRILSDD